jgi:hypothetical protein
LSTRPATVYAYLLIGFGLVILAISLWAMIQALDFYDRGEFPQFIVYAIMAAVGTVLSLSSITQMRRRMIAFQSLATRVLSSVVCANCGFKVVRTFIVGDYVPKEVGQCQQCKGSMRVDTIYAEEPKGKKPKP